MKYKALKPCSFAGVSYLVGDIIPDGIVHASASVRLTRGGVLEAVDGVGATPPLTSTLETEDEVPEEPIIEEVIESVEPEIDEEPEIDGEADALTVDKLMRLKRNEMLELAEANGMEMSKMKALKKPELAEAIFEVIGK